MKKNSFKRFLAVTLAAATALTFAPVSTLGLTGVVEAQAATGDLSTTENSGTTFTDGDVKVLSGKAQTTTPVYGYFDVQGSTTNDVKIAVSDLPDGVTVQTKGSDGKWANTTSPITIEKQSSSASDVEYRFAVEKAASGTATVKTVDNTTTATAKVVFNVTGPATKATFTNSAKKALSDADTTVYVDKAGTGFLDADGNAVTKIDVTATPTGGDIADLGPVSSDIDVATVSYTSSTGVIEVTPKKAGVATINVYPDSDAKTAEAPVIGSFKVYVKTVKTDSLKAADLVNSGADQNFTYTLVDAIDADKLVILDSNGKDVSDEFIYNDSSLETIGKISVKTSAADKGTYTAEIFSATGKVLAKDTFEVTGSSSSDSSKSYLDGDTINAAPQDNLILTDKTTYNLVDNVTISYGNIVYPASQLTWYLTKNLTSYKVGDEIKDLAKKSDANVSLGSAEGDLKAGKGVLTLTVNGAKEAADKLTPATDQYYIAATASINGKTTLVYLDSNAFKAAAVTGKTQVVNASISASSSKNVDNNSFLDGQRIYNPSQENYYLKAADFDLTGTEATDKNIFDVDLTDANKDGYNVLKGSSINGATSNLANGVYYETVYQKYNTNNVIKLVVAVSINAGPKGHVSDGAYVYAATDGTEVPEDATLYMDLKQNKTFSIPDHFTADTANTSLSYDTNSANVKVDKGVITAVSEGTCDVKVTPTANGVDGTPLIIHVQVNANPFNTFSVNEEKNVDDKATVLNEKDFKDNLVDTEAQLVTKKIDYVEVFVTGNETQNVTETPVVTPASKTNITYSFYKDYSGNGLTIDPKTGKITIDYTKIKDGTAEKYGQNLYAVKVVANSTSDAAQTTGYFYVVVDYPDQKISGIVTDQDYIVGTCAKDEAHATAVDLYKEESGKSASKFMAIQSNKTYDFVGKPLYDKDSIKSFETSLGTNAGSIVRAYTADKTMHVLAYNDQVAAEKLGYTAVIASFKSAAADDNYVSKIVNKETGEVLYDHTVNAGDTARELKIDKTTTIQVTLAHPVASAVSGSAVHLSIDRVENDGHIYNQQPYVTGVVNSKEVDVALYPNNKGTSVIELGPTGHLTKTNRTDIHHNSVNVAVTYTGEASADAKNPAQVKGVKVSNKKGAKVTVKFNKITANSTMRYYVQKKVGKKVSGKSIGSTKTTLSVKKGATVKVRVKAYYYDANGVKHVGKYSSWKTLKTDKK